jgi:hypothetical protein
VPLPAARQPAGRALTGASVRLTLHASVSGVRQRALFIGINDYAFAPLSSCVNDAVAMRDAVVRLGIVAPEDCALMTSPARPDAVEVPTRRAILGWLRPLYRERAPLDRLLVFFAGHGLSVRLGREAEAMRTVIVPAGVQALSDSGDELIDLDELLGRFARRGAREQLWIVDACRNLPPDGIVPNVAQVPWDRPPPNDPREARQMAQAALYAVAPLGRARAVAGGHGLLTTHLLHGLACEDAARWGAASYYDEARGTWLIDVESLCEYAAARIGAEIPAESWEREYLLPRVWSGEQAPGPLREVGVLPDRPFVLRIEPPEAAAAVNAWLSVNRNPIAGWPPHVSGQPVPLPPGRYRLQASLAPGAAGWSPPSIPEPVVDLRACDEVSIEVSSTGARQMQARSDAGLAPTQLAQTRVAAPPAAAPPAGHVRPGATATDDRKRSFEWISQEPSAPREAVKTRPLATLTVRASDPGAAVRLTRLSGGRGHQMAAAGKPISIEPGLWRVEILLGSDVIAVREEDFSAGQEYELSMRAQVTPALAALLADGALEAQQSLTPSESIGPMQGAILPTLLPLLAVKPLDARGAILRSFSPRLGIPRVAPETDAPAAFALALDGAWDGARGAARADTALVHAGGAAAHVWSDPSARVSLFLQAAPRPRDGARIELPAWGALEAAAPRLAGYCTTIAATLWPDGAADVSISLLRLPPGADPLVRPDRLSRALAIASRLFRAGASLDDVDLDVFALISSGRWGDPVLGSLAWLGRARQLARPALARGDRRRLEARQRAAHDFLLREVPSLPDARVIAALARAKPRRDTALDALLDDPALEQPVLADTVAALARRALARGRAAHWSVARYQALATDAVFNAIRLPISTSRPEDSQ